jgi:hypothetical protein
VWELKGGLKAGGGGGGVSRGSAGEFLRLCRGGRNGTSVGLGADVSAQIEWGLQWGWWWGSCGLVGGGLTGGRTTAWQGGTEMR